MDFSLTALREVRPSRATRPGASSGDVAGLPLRDDAVDGLVSMHTTDHVLLPEQRSASVELHRVLAPGAQGVVASIWGASLFLS